MEAASYLSGISGALEDKRSLASARLRGKRSESRADSTTKAEDKPKGKGRLCRDI